MKVSELDGPQLDCWVAKAEGRVVEICEDDGVCRLSSTMGRYEPHRDWAIGGPIIERERIGIELHGRSGLEWGAWVTMSCYESNDPDATGPTPLVAAMRAYVLTKFGAEVAEVVSHQRAGN